MWVPNRHCDNPNVTDFIKQNAVILGTLTAAHQNDNLTHITYYLYSGKLYTIKGYLDAEDNRKASPVQGSITDLLNVGVPIPCHLVPHFFALAKTENLMATYVIIHESDDPRMLRLGDIIVLDKLNQVRDIMSRIYGNVLLEAPQRYYTKDIGLTLAAINQSG